jgi:hypothetical protein
MNWARLRLALGWILANSSRQLLKMEFIDIGSSDGETLRHLRSCVRLAILATDLVGQPETYPVNCQFFQGRPAKDPPVAKRIFNAITCMHLEGTICAILPLV